MMVGRFSEAAVHSEQMLASGAPLNDVNCLNSFGIHAAIQLWESDRAAQVIPFAEEFVHKYPMAPGWQFSRAFMCFEAGLVDTARIQFEVLARNNFARIPSNEQWSISTVLAADLCYRLEDRPRAEFLYSQLCSARSLYCVIGFGVANLGSIAPRLAMLASVMGRWDLADEHFEDAIRMEESIGSLPWLAHAFYWYAKSCSMRSDPSDVLRAIDYRRRGIEIARTTGMKTLVRRFDELRKLIKASDRKALP
jgi:tetratricopeptide (TPR) repeat protein